MPEWLIPAVTVFAAVLAATVTLVIASGGGLLYLGRWMGRVDEHRSSVAAFMAEIRAKIDDLANRIPQRPTTAKSPLRLTPFGSDLAASLEAYEWAMQTAPRLADDLRPLTENYQVDHLARKYVEEDLAGNDMSGRVDSVAYERGIEREDVLSVLRVVLRDELLKIHASQRNAPVEDID